MTTECDSQDIQMEVWSQYLPADTKKIVTIQDSFHAGFEPNLPIMKQNTNH